MDSLKGKPVSSSNHQGYLSGSLFVLYTFGPELCVGVGRTIVAIIQIYSLSSGRERCPSIPLCPARRGWILWRVEFQVPQEQVLIGLALQRCCYLSLVSGWTVECYACQKVRRMSSYLYFFKETFVLELLTVHEYNCETN